MEHLVRNVVGDVRPDGDHLVVTLAVGDGAFLVLLLNIDHFLFGIVHQLGFAERHHEIVDADRYPRLGGVKETEGLDLVQHPHRGLQAEAQVAVIHQPAKTFLPEQAVDEGHAAGQMIVENHAPDRSVDELVLHRDGLGVKHVLVIISGRQVNHAAGEPQADGRKRFNLPRFQG